MDMKEAQFEYRMYGLVPYNLSPIQQGIQFGHAVVEYAQEYGFDESYKKWARIDKTFIILNGGTTNFHPDRLGTLNQHRETIAAMWGDYAVFFEPDLGDQLTAVVFLVDERVWNKEKYPGLMDIPEWMTDEFEINWRNEINKKNIEAMGGNHIWLFREFLSQFRFA